MPEKKKSISNNKSGVKSGNCPLYKKCGGCQLQNLTYEQQLRYKQVKCIRLLGKFCRVGEIIGMENPYHYRNKVQAAFALDRHSNIISGVYQSSSHKIVPVTVCMTEDEKADEIIGTIRRLLKNFKLRPYNEDTGRGFLRHVLVKRGFKSGQIMVVLVTGTRDFPKKKDFVATLLKIHPEITTVVQNVNNQKTSMVLGNRSEVLFGDGYITEQLGDFSFRISPRAFYQINPIQTEVLYNTTLEFAGLTGKETVVGNVVVGKHDAFRESRSAGGVLHVHYIVASDLTFEFIQAAVFYIVAQEKYFGRVVHAPVLLLPHVDDVFHIRETFAFQVSALAGLQFRKHGIGHLHKVTVLFAIDDAEGMHVGVLAEIFQLGLFVVGVYRYVDGTYLGASV